MPKKLSKQTLKWIIGVGRRRGRSRSSAFGTGRRSRTALPEGIASGNGRLEAKLVDVAAKEPLRVKEILVDEGALVKPGQVLVQLDTVTLEAQLAEANAGIAAAQERLAVAKASIAKQKSEIELAEIEVDALRKAGRARAPARSEIWTFAGRSSRRPRPASRKRKRCCRPPRSRSRSRGPTRRRSKRASTTRRSSPPSPEESCIAWPKPARSSLPAERR